MSHLFEAKLSKEIIHANKKVYIAALERLFHNLGRSMNTYHLLKREVDGRPDHYSRLVYGLNEHGLEPIYYDFHKKEWVRSPNNEKYKLLLDRYLEPSLFLEQTVNDLVLKYLIGDINISTVSWKTSHLYKE